MEKKILDIDLKYQYPKVCIPRKDLEAACEWCEEHVTAKETTRENWLVNSHFDKSFTPEFVFRYKKHAVFFALRWA
jgi:hypothetical protein